MMKRRAMKAREPDKAEIERLYMGRYCIYKDYSSGPFELDAVS